MNEAELVRQCKKGEMKSQKQLFDMFSDRPRWTGIGIGFLVHNRSDLFTGKTLKLFIESDIGSPKLNVIPELYLTDDYKQAIFGLKLNYKF